MILNRLLLAVALSLAGPALQRASGATTSVERGACPPGSQVMFFYAEDLDSRTRNGFTSEVFGRLRQSLAEVGYCLQPFNPSAALSDTSLNANLIMYVAVAPPAQPNTSDSGGLGEAQGALTVGLVEIRGWSEQGIGRAMSHPLLSLPYDARESATFDAVFVKKTVENLRTQYVCHLRIQSQPPGISITTSSGLRGTTPLEWILPVGVLSVTGQKEQLETVHQKLNLTPGVHTHVLYLRKRQFYRSGFIYPALAFGLASAACYAAERYYYQEYLDLGRDDYLNDPDRFGTTFGTAKNLEYAALAGLACAGVSLGLSMRF